MREYDIITFDCYGTLIDWESGIADAFAPLLERSSATIEDILDLHARIEPEIQSGAWRPYREVLEETAKRISAAAGLRVDHRGDYLPESVPSWKPFADTNPALERLRSAGIRLGILSNIDDDLLTETLKHFTVDFDLVITAQQLHSYKPARAHFDAARRVIGDARWLHAAQSNFHDIVPTNDLGIDNAWINRKSETALPGGTPTREFADLMGLADWVTPSTEED